MYKLAIAIPTYNRPNELGDNLNNILSVLIKEKIKVYISDDSLNDDTQDLVAKLRLKYDNFNYIKNSPKAIFLVHPHSSHTTHTSHSFHHLFHLRIAAHFFHHIH